MTDKRSQPLDLETLIARAEISDVVNRYATGIDRRDWELYRSCFADEMELDFTSWSGGEPSHVAAEQWVAGVRDGLSGFDATHHVSSNHVITVTGDSATCVSYMVAYHIFATGMGENIFTLGGHYTNRLRKTNDEWKIWGCKLTVTWATGNRHLFELAHQRWTDQK